MYKISKLFFLLIAILTLYADGDYEVNAKEFIKNGNILDAIGDVVVTSKNQFITASRAKYNYDTKELELFDDVYIYDFGVVNLRSDYLKLFTSSQVYFTNNALIVKKHTNEWYSSKSIKKAENKYYFKDFKYSSCNASNPDWKLSATSGDYDTKAKWVNMYNSVITIYGVPVLYFPYFGYPTDNSRRSGFLPLRFGFLDRDGFTYVQPYYIAPYKNWDIEILPQIRVNRGIGIYSKFRWVDSLYSTLYSELGYFNDYDTYTNKYKIANPEHYGIEFKYNRSKMFFGSKDKLYVNLKYFNDTDYYNLKKLKTTPTGYLKNVESIVNYVYSGDIFYYGIYPRYYIDTTKQTNEKTLQLLPHQQAHIFSTPIFINNLLYSIDIRDRRYTRDSGINATQKEIIAPFGFYLSFWDYLRTSVTQNLYFTSIQTSNLSTADTTGNLFKGFVKANVNLDMARDFDWFFHIFRVGGYGVVPDFEYKNGAVPNIDNDLEDYEFSDEDTSFLTYLSQSRSLNMYIYNYIYPKDFIDSISLRTTQSSTPNSDFTQYSLGELINQFNISFKNSININHNFKYSHNDEKFTSQATGFSYKNSDTSIQLSHSYNNTTSISEYFTSKLKQKLPYKYAAFGDFTYDIKSDYLKNYTVGMSYKKKCWNYTVKLSRTITPVLTNTEVESVVSQSIYFSITLVPLGSYAYTFN